MKVKNPELVVKDIHTNKMWHFENRWEAAWFVGTSVGTMERELEVFKEEALVYCVGDKEFIIISDGNERTPTLGRHTCPMNGYAEVVSSTGVRERFDSYISVAKHLGLLVGHVIEEKVRNKEGLEPNEYVNDEGVFRIEFEKKEM